MATLGLGSIDWALGLDTKPWEAWATEASESAIDPALFFHVSQDPLYNKGTGYEHGERDRLNIRGLLPPRHLDFQTQIARVRF
jgi:hypothetical protein